MLNSKSTFKTNVKTTLAIAMTGVAMAAELVDARGGGGAGMGRGPVGGTYNNGAMLAGGAKSEHGNINTMLVTGAVAAATYTLLEDTIHHTASMLYDRGCKMLGYGNTEEKNQTQEVKKDNDRLFIEKMSKGKNSSNGIGKVAESFVMNK